MYFPEISYKNFRSALASGDALGVTGRMVLSEPKRIEENMKDNPISQSIVCLDFMFCNLSELLSINDIYCVIIFFSQIIE